MFDELKDPELVEMRQAWEQRLATEALRGGMVYLRGKACSGQTDMYADPGKRVDEALEKLAGYAEKLRDPDVFRPLSVDAALHGVHFVDKIFGADVYELAGERGNWQARYLTSPVGRLDRPDLDSNPTWRAAREFALAFVERGVTVPVFMLPTIASALNVGLNLYGQELLMAMLSDPDYARHDLDVINSVILEIHRWYLDNVPRDLLHQVCCSGRYQPPGCGQICGCSTQLVSPEHYKEFIAGHDEAVLSLYDNGGMIHLCGTHTQHIPVWREMQSLRAVQLNDRAAEDLEVYLQEMPEKIYYVQPCEGMPQERILTSTQGNAIVIADC